MTDYIVPSGLYSEQKIKGILAEINALDDQNLIQKLDKLGVPLDDYLALCEDERFRQSIVSHAFYMIVIPNTARFINRHMQAAMKGGRGSARVVLKLWAAFNKTLENAAYDRKSGDKVYLDFRQMSQEQLEQELNHWQHRLSEMTKPLVIDGARAPDVAQPLDGSGRMPAHETANSTGQETNRLSQSNSGAFGGVAASHKTPHRRSRKKAEGKEAPHLPPDSEAKVNP